MTSRPLQRTIPSLETSDGAGVRLRRSLGQGPDVRLDPFLMLDQFGTDNPDDYIAGFPAHPHRGFETVTYMIDGHMRHEDHLGNQGDLRTGGVQWMTAGRGIVHSEMPQQTEGRMRGFQLWINLPAAEKMKPAGYRDIQPEEMPVIELADGGQVKLIAGALSVEHRELTGPITGLTTEPLLADVTLPAGHRVTLPVPSGHNAFIYAYEGSLRIGPESTDRELPGHAAGILGPGDQVEVTAADDARFILVAGKPISEPIVQYGPFVMNTREEIEQTLRDYQSGRLTQTAA